MPVSSVLSSVSKTRLLTVFLLLVLAFWTYRYFSPRFFSKVHYVHKTSLDGTPLPSPTWQAEKTTPNATSLHEKTLPNHFTAKTLSQQITAAGVMRSYEEVRVSKASSASPDTTLEASNQSSKASQKLIFLVFHGDGGSGPSMHEAWPLEEVFMRMFPKEQTETLFLYPTGLSHTWDTHSGVEENLDLAFVKTLLDKVLKEEEGNSGPPPHIAFVGYSSGAFLANLFACEYPDLVSSLVSHAGGAPYHRSETWPNGYPKCKHQNPIPMLAMHGTLDMGVALSSGEFSAQYWAYVNGCKLNEMENSGYQECAFYTECPNEKPVGFCKVPGLTHWIWSLGAEAGLQFTQALRLHSAPAPTSH